MHHHRARVPRQPKVVLATCTGGDTVCTGGGQTCTGGEQQCTHHSHQEPRERQVAVYRDDPVYRDHFRWTTWQWVPNRNVPASAHDVNPHPPSAAEVNLGEKERATFDLTCSVVFTNDDDHKREEYKPTDCAGAFQALPVGTRKRIRVGSLGGVEIVVPKK